MYHSLEMDRIQLSRHTKVGLAFEDEMEALLDEMI